MGDRDEEDLYELRGGGDDIGTEKEWEGKGEEWEFGGLSGDGRAGGGVPVCKHLVACILGERWDVLEGYIQEREMSRDEMGGVSGEG